MPPDDNDYHYQLPVALHQAPANDNQSHCHVAAHHSISWPKISTVGGKKNLLLARVNAPAENSDCIVLYVRYGSIISFRYLYATLTELSAIPAV